LAPCASESGGSGEDPSRLDEIARQIGEYTDEERAMKKFMILHFGFEDPTPEIMEA